MPITNPAYAADRSSSGLDDVVVASDNNARGAVVEVVATVAVASAIINASVEYLNWRGWSKSRMLSKINVDAMKNSNICVVKGVMVHTRFTSLS